ncbi:tRNA pseudouridine(55) synthase TruB [Fusobacterium vincentii]|uniref:tRNA pseudouridine(55) synthase TruB n=1 Tax=Fusobacterium TaxID=848 RepID=UPI0002BD3075|nr:MULTISPECIES: tRNA pseudouridine(55) synthase TruB [Fusobacterium]ATV05877.1 tRNA pseudouridine(55) synthase TruB [Fusobacterium vincentii]EMP16649.1 tRNA pseudouridine synthase B [Fusobacterium nucleatum CC53]QYR56653.1 tRNA pseudouridine(55) synthase TruB [Fusobacterium vincentii]BET14907.1 tRNA pseudouridine(55) synthase TruB [Fusobacterium vincentii]
MEGIIVVNKTKGITSFDVIRKLKKILKTKKIGHTGTLDPLATGVMLVCVGKATKLASDLEAKNKIYIADFDIGYATDTYDVEGKKIAENIIEVSKENLEQSIKKFIGNIKQVPPMYSAIKIDGNKLYHLARKGIEVERPKRDVTIEYINLLDFKNNKAKIETEVSKGCYIRSLIYDIGQNLGTYATMTALQRKQVGEYSLENSYNLEQIEEMTLNNNFKFLKTVEEIFSYDKYNLQTEKEFILYKNGNTVKIKENLESKRYRIYFQDKFIGLANIENNNLLKGYKYY